MFALYRSTVDWFFQMSSASRWRHETKKRERLLGQDQVVTSACVNGEMAESSSAELSLLCEGNELETRKTQGQDGNRKATLRLIDFRTRFNEGNDIRQATFCFSVSPPHGVVPKYYVPVQHNVKSVKLIFDAAILRLGRYQSKLKCMVWHYVWSGCVLKQFHKSARFCFSMIVVFTVRYVRCWQQY